MFNITQKNDQEYFSCLDPYVDLLTVKYDKALLCHKLSVTTCKSGLLCTL